jgi:serine/threonine-protein kinase
LLTQLGPFQILEVIARGGMGTVYRGIDPIIGRPVAVKVIRLVGYKDQDEQAWLKQRLFKEAQAAGGLSHPGIVTIYHVGEENDVAYIAMEYVDGPTLQHLLAGESRNDKRLLCRMLCDTAAALDYAHVRGVIHRDIKPANIMLSAAGTTKVTDFGIAKTMLGQTATRTGMILGTPFYMSPEQIRGKALDGRSDQFALAVVAYEVFAGRKPFESEQITSVCYQIVHEHPIPVEDLNPAVGDELAGVIKRGLAKDAGERFQTCTEFASALAAAFRSSCRGAASPPIASSGLAAGSPEVHERAPERSSQPVRRRDQIHPPPVKAVRAAIAGVGACLLVLGGLATIEGRRADQRENPDPVIRSVPRPVPSSERASPELSHPTRPVEPRRIPGPVPMKPPVEQVAETFAPKASSEVRPSANEDAPTRQVTDAVRQGILVWTGRLAGPGLVTISGANSSIGSLSGHLPRSPISVQVYPAESRANGFTAFTADSQYANSVTLPSLRGPITLTYDPRHATDIAVFEKPGPENEWERLVLRINNPRISGCIIQWSSE